jgi:hypothetical protein
MSEHRYGFGNNFYEVKGNKSGGTVGGSSISTEQYSFLIKRANSMNMDLQAFINFLNQVKNAYGIEPEVYVVVKRFADQNKIDFNLIIPYVKAGVRDLNHALQDLINRGVICSSTKPGFCNQSVVSTAGVEEVELNEMNSSELESQIPNSSCPINNIPFTPNNSPLNNPNSQNLEPLELIGENLNEIKEEPKKEEVKKPKSFSKEVIEISNKFNIHPETIEMLLDKASVFPNLTLEEYITLAIQANRNGKTVVEFYKLYASNKGKVQTVNKKMLQNGKETDIIISDLMSQVQTNSVKEANSSEAVAYGKSALDNPKGGASVGGVHLDKRNTQIKLPVFGSGTLGIPNQPVFGQNKNAYSGNNKSSYKFGS